MKLPLKTPGTVRHVLLQLEVSGPYSRQGPLWVGNGVPGRFQDPERSIREVLQCSFFFVPFVYLGRVSAVVFGYPSVCSVQLSLISAGWSDRSVMKCLSAFGFRSSGTTVPKGSVGKLKKRGGREKNGAFPSAPVHGNLIPLQALCVRSRINRLPLFCSGRRVLT